MYDKEELEMKENKKKYFFNYSMFPKRVVIACKDRRSYRQFGVKIIGRLVI